MPLRFGKLEFVHSWFGVTVALLFLLYGDTVPHRWAWILGHGVLVPLIGLGLSRLTNPWPRYLFTVLFVPTVFTTMGAYLPDLVPEPFAYRILPFNEALGGSFVQALADRPPAWLVEICVLCYSTFFFLPICLGVVFALKRQWFAVRHGAILLTGAFLLSYLGYLCWPTLPPYRFLEYSRPLEGGPLFPWVHMMLYEGEPLRQDCMPSGHTMITLLTCGLALRYAPRQLIWLGPISVFLILATILLRYHWWVDLLAALPLAAFAWFFFEDREAHRLRRAESGQGTEPLPGGLSRAGAPGPG